MIGGDIQLSTASKWTGHEERFSATAAWAEDGATIPVPARPVARGHHDTAITTRPSPPAITTGHHHRAVDAEDISEPTVH